ncbi:MAG: 50S ribosomal protein P1 [Thermoplasmata archaeon]|nr:MAG: 50S ribosomal protein P1 [Thermoplasmata archaeon]MCD6147142.1 50S ribosomal protein P1 [Thermoplasmata archaeon]RLF44452.1 MAG: 50S ribosomal protein P1 [Thermoplasmata archaeon]RLF64255.1 MAG: 50S ribosomal protein P1 [Thermoplasmata archaeon]
MEYVYGAMLLHSAGKEINEDNLKKVLDAAGIEVDDAKIKVLVSSLEDVDIEEAISKAAVAPVAAAAPEAAKTEEKEEKKEEAEEKEEEVSEEEVAEGLGALFG